jgi:hypothetical protein
MSNREQISSWAGFCLYVAGGVFLQDIRKHRSNPQSTSNLEFIVSAMKALGNRHSVTKHFSAQLEFDIENSNLDPSKMASNIYKSYDKGASTLDDDDICSFPLRTKTKPENQTNVSASNNGTPTKNIIPVGLKGVLPPHTSSGPYDNYTQIFYQNIVANQRSQQDSGSDTLDTDFSFAMGNTPSSDSSASVQNATGTNTYAYRTPKPNEMDEFGTGDNAWAFEAGFPDGDLSLTGSGLNAADGFMGLMNGMGATGFEGRRTDGAAEQGVGGAGSGEENPPENELLNSLLDASTSWEGGIVSLASGSGMGRC